MKTIKRSAARSAAAAAAEHVGKQIACQREARVQDCARKQGVEWAIILTEKNAPDWAKDRSFIWNEVEANETRHISVTAREWSWPCPQRSAPRTGRRSRTT